MALCAQPLGWLTFVEVLETLLLSTVTVKERVGVGGQGGCVSPPNCVQWRNGVEWSYSEVSDQRDVSPVSKPSP